MPVDLIEAHAISLTAIDEGGLSSRFGNDHEEFEIGLGECGESGGFTCSWFALEKDGWCTDYVGHLVLLMEWYNGAWKAEANS